MALHLAVVDRPAALVGFSPSKNALLQRALDEARYLALGVADLTGFVDLVAAKAEIGNSVQERGAGHRQDDPRPYHL